MPAPDRLPDPFPCPRTEEQIASDLREQLAEVFERWRGTLEADRVAIRRGEQMGLRFHA